MHAMRLVFSLICLIIVNFCSRLQRPDKAVIVPGIFQNAPFYIE